MKIHLRSAAFAIVVSAASAQSAVTAWHLDDLPAYAPASHAHGTVRIIGNPLGGLLEAWERGFGHYQPDVTFTHQFGSGETAVAGLACGASDLGPSGREATFSEIESAYDLFPGKLLDLKVACGTFDVRTTWSVMIFVNRRNPLSGLSLRQLDGIFGAERTAGFAGYKWVPESGRDSSQNLRTWDQVGLTGKWAGQAIQTYGYAAGGTASFFQLKVFQGGDKWNPNYREYVETGSKMVVDSPAGQDLTVAHMLQELSNDTYGIAWTGYPQAATFPGVKLLAIAPRESGAAIMPSAETVRDESYPLARSVYIYLKHGLGDALDPAEKEFLRYVLSREGQQAVAQGKRYLPLSAASAAHQLLRLN